MDGPVSPTYCRPQHLDRERLRRLIARKEFENVCYHEAVVVVDGMAAPAFKLLAVTSDALLLLPLGSGGGGGASPSGVPTTPCTRVAFCDIVAVDRTSPTQTKLRGIMLHANSELFGIAVASGLGVKLVTQPSVFVATFEPSSRAFFYVVRATRLEFQKRILADATADRAGQSDLGDLCDLLSELVRDFADLEDELSTRCELLHELATAATCNPQLQKLCFQDQSALPSAVASGATVYGLPGFLLDEIVHLADGYGSSHHPHEVLLEYHLSLLQLMHRLLFGGHWVPERLRFFLHTPLDAWLRTITSVPTIAKSLKTDQWRVASEDLLDLQVALVLELQLAQEEATLLDHGSSVVTHGLITGPHEEWIAKLFKRVAVLMARTSKNHESAMATSGSSWSLALWRATSLLVEILRVSSVKGSGMVTEMLRCRRRDYLDLYLRNPRFGRALASSTIPHLVQVADGLLEVLDILS